jgi:hypothetical protein
VELAKVDEEMLVEILTDAWRDSLPVSKKRSSPKWAR